MVYVAGSIHIIYKRVTEALLINWYINNSNNYSMNGGEVCQSQYPHHHYKDIITLVMVFI